MVAHRKRPDPARPPARQGAGRHLRPAAAAEGASAAADAGACQPAFPAARAGHRRRRAATPPVPLCRRPRASQRRPLARSGRSHRTAGRRRLCARDAPRAGAQPARGLPLHPGPSPAALLRSLARIAALRRAGQREPAQHGAADAGLAVGHLFRACLPVARARDPARRGRRHGGARRPGLDQDAGRPAARACAAAAARQFLRRSAGDARRFGAWRNRPRRGDAQRQDRARQRAGVGGRRDAGDDAVPRTGERTAAGRAARTAVARRLVAGRTLGVELRPGQPRPHDRASLPRPGPRADHRRHAGTCRAPGAGRPHPSPASSWRNIR